MFRRRKGEDDTGMGIPGEGASDTSAAELPALKPFLRSSAEDTLPPKPVAQPTPAPARAELPRRLVDLPGVATRASTPASAIPLPSSISQVAAQPVLNVPAPENESKKLIVGRDIRLNGEITSCEHLVVEGSVEATLADGKIVDVAQTGTFHGAIECETASIRGKFDGELTCHERLVVRSSGRVIGKIRYRQLEVERGGELSGDIQMIQSGAQSAATVTPIFGDEGSNSSDAMVAASADR